MKQSPCVYTHMHQEIETIPHAIERVLHNADAKVQQVIAQVRQYDPAFLVTIARGSSDHCAHFLQYAFAIYARLPVVSLAPSIASIYKAELQLARSCTLAISQSGESPDIVEATKMARRNDSYTLAITNNISSPLALACHHALDIAAGEEKSVAATKTFINSLVMGVLLLAHYTNNADLIRAIEVLPKQCEQALECRWSSLLQYLHAHNSLYVLGRGPTMAIAAEIALKFKETCQIHAEVYSSAEVMHGPAALIKNGFPVIVLSNCDASQDHITDTLISHNTNNGEVFSNGLDKTHTNYLSIPNTNNPLTQPIVTLVSFYVFLEQLAQQRGNNPDTPPNLRKVTQTL